MFLRVNECYVDEKAKLSDTSLTPIRIVGLDLGFSGFRLNKIKFLIKTCFTGIFLF